MGIMHPQEVMKNIVPVIMAGILGIYGLIVAAILVGKIQVRRPPPCPPLRSKAAALTGAPDPPAGIAACCPHRPLNVPGHLVPRDIRSPPGPAARLGPSESDSQRHSQLR